VGPALTGQSWVVVPAAMAEGSFGEVLLLGAGPGFSIFQIFKFFLFFINF
jgi:hypothetical protein